MKEHALAAGYGAAHLFDDLDNVNRVLSYGVHPCATNGCPVQIPNASVRAQCHGCLRTLAGPLTVDRLARYGLCPRQR